MKPCGVTIKRANGRDQLPTSAASAGAPDDAPADEGPFPDTALSDEACPWDALAPAEPPPAEVPEDGVPVAEPLPEDAPEVEDNDEDDDDNDGALPAEEEEPGWLEAPADEGAVEDEDAPLTVPPDDAWLEDATEAALLPGSEAADVPAVIPEDDDGEEDDEDDGFPCVVSGAGPHWGHAERTNAPTAVRVAWRRDIMAVSPEMRFHPV